MTRRRNYSLSETVVMNGKLPKIVVAMPTADGSVNQTVMVHLITAMETLGLPVQLMVEQGALVYEARASLLDRARKAGAQRIIWIDDDIIVAHEDLKILNDALDTYTRPAGISALYSTRSMIGGDYAVDWLGEEPESLAQYGMIAVRGFGLGLAAFRLSSSLPRSFLPEEGVGEDIAWCRRIEGELLVDLAVRPGHLIDLEVNADWVAQQKSELRLALART